MTLGRISMNKFIPSAKDHRCSWTNAEEVDDQFVIPMFHPAAALHQAALKPSILADFARLPDQLNEARVALGKPVIIKEKIVEENQDKPKQLSLF